MHNLLPPNATTLERNLADVNASLGDLPTPQRDLMNPDTCPAGLLPWLAQAMSVDLWSPEWTEGQKREAIKASLNVHRMKGTIGAVRRALSAVGFHAELQEWFNQVPVGAPYTFRLLLTTDQVGYDQEGLERLQRLVEATKNLRSHVAEIVPRLVSVAGPTVAIVASMGIEVTAAGFAYTLLADGTVKADGEHRANGIRYAK